MTWYELLPIVKRDISVLQYALDAYTDAVKEQESVLHNQKEVLKRKDRQIITTAHTEPSEQNSLFHSAPLNIKKRIRNSGTPVDVMANLEEIKLKHKVPSRPKRGTRYESHIITSGSDMEIEALGDNEDDQIPDENTSSDMEVESFGDNEDEYVPSDCEKQDDSGCLSDDSYKVFVQSQKKRKPKKKSPTALFTPQQTIEVIAMIRAARAGKTSRFTKKQNEELLQRVREATNTTIAKAQCSRHAINLL